MLPENEETERIPAEYQRRLIVESVAIREIATENELPDRSEESLVLVERFVQKRKVQEDGERTDGHQDDRKTRAPEDREHADVPKDGRKTDALEACGSTLHQTGKTRRG